MTPQEICDRAADYIEAHGWCQYTFEDDLGRVCAEGAITHIGTAGEYELRVEARRLLRVLLNGEPDTGSTTRWNDDPTRTKEEVIAALRAAARQG